MLDCLHDLGRSWMMVVTSPTGYIKSTPVCLRRFKELWRRASLEFIGEQQTAKCVAAWENPSHCKFGHFQNYVVFNFENYKYF